MKDVLKFMISQYLRYRWQTAVIALLTVFALSYQVTFSYSFKYLVDHILVPGLYDRLGLFLTLLIAGAILSSVTDLLAESILLKIAIRMQDELRYRVFRQLQMLPESYYRRQSSSSVIARLSFDLNTIHAAFLALQATVSVGLGLLFSLALLYVMNPWFCLCLLVGLPLCFIIPKAINRKTTSATDLYKTRENFNELIMDRLNFHVIFRAYGLQAWERKRLENMTDEVAPMGFRAQLLRSFLSKSVTISLLLLNVAVIAIGAYLSRYDLVTVGTLVAFQSFYIRISSYASSLTRHFPTFVQAELSWGRLTRVILDHPGNPEEAPDQIGPLPEFRNRLELADVSFGYAADKKTLHHLNLSIPKGAHCAIVGSSGSGKTSIVGLLMRFYEPDEGGLKLDGQEVRELPLEAYRRLTAYVPQDVALFPCSLRENIRFGRLTATDGEVEAAARSADIHDWILAQPRGYDELVGEGGRFLSGGQRQRLALARAFVRQPNILILDEATSSLDPGTEQAIMATLRDFDRSATIISVTHRLQTIERMNPIIVIDQGKLAGYGSHRELLGGCETYRNLWFKQSGFVISDDGSDADITMERLKMIPFFRMLDETMQAETQQAMVTEQKEADAIIIKQGEVGHMFYIIVRGKVEVEQADELGHNHSLAVLEDGDHFGEMALLKQIPRTATIRTLTPCVFLMLRREWFQKAIARSPELKRQLEISFAARAAMHR